MPDNPILRFAEREAAQTGSMRDRMTAQLYGHQLGQIEAGKMREERQKARRLEGLNAMLGKAKDPSGQIPIIKEMATELGYDASQIIDAKKGLAADIKSFGGMVEDDSVPDEEAWKWLTTRHPFEDLSQLKPEAPRVGVPVAGEDVSLPARDVYLEEQKLERARLTAAGAGAGTPTIKDKEGALKRLTAIEADISAARSDPSFMTPELAARFGTDPEAKETAIRTWEQEAGNLRKKWNIADPTNVRMRDIPETSGGSKLDSLSKLRTYLEETLYFTRKDSDRWIAENAR
jgi:hypothetical protein